MKNQLQIREATLADAGAIANIHVNMWRFAYKSILPKHFLQGISTEERSKLRQRILENKAQYTHHFVAVLDGHLIGFCDIGPCKDENTSWDNGQLYALYLHPWYMRRGVGRQLLEVAEETLKADGFKTASLWLIDKNTIGLAFYEKHNWQFAGTQKTVTNHGISYDVVRYQKTL